MQDETSVTQHLNAIRQLLRTVVVLMIFAAIYFAKSLLFPLVIGLLLALTVSPVVRTLGRAGIPPAVTAGVLIIGMGSVVLTFFYLMSGTLSVWVSDLPAMGAEIKSKLSGIFSSVEAVKDATEEVGKLAEGEGKQVQEVTIQQPPMLTSFASNLASFAISLGVGMILAFFLLASGNTFYTKLVQSYTRFADKKRALKIVYDIEKRISRYLLAISAINFGLGVVIAAVLYLLGMPYALLWGLLAFAMNYVPFIGAMVTAAAAAAVAIITFDTVGYALLVPMSILVISSIEGQMVTPALLGRRLELNTVSVFLAVIFWAWLWGVPGALMAVPALVVLKVVADNFEGMATVSHFLGNTLEAPSEPD